MVDANGAPVMVPLRQVVVPVLYTYLDNLPRWFKRRFGGTESTRPAVVVKVSGASS